MTHQHRRSVGTGHGHIGRSFVCWRCRYHSKAGPEEQDNRRCPRCRDPLYDVGKNFKPPRKDDVRGWATAHAKFGAHTLHPAARARLALSARLKLLPKRSRRD